MSQDFDLLIKNGWVIDGTGNPRTLLDVGVKGDTIAAIDRNVNANAEKVVDAEGKIVCPGFIDLHNHADLAILAYPHCESHIMQGITTSVGGNCGLSMAPLNPKELDLLKQYLSAFIPKGFDWGWDWTSPKTYFEKVEKNGMSVNMAPLVGQGAIRLAIRGFDAGESTTEQLEEMKNLLRESLEWGVFGMSTGLIYPPGSYSNTEELIELAKVMHEYGGIYTSHVRNEGDRLMESVEEAIRIAEEAEVPLEISHHKAMGKYNWGKVNATLREMERARARGVDVTCDCYPYTAASTTLTSLLPPWTMVGGVTAMLERLKDKEKRKQIAEEISTNKVQMENMIRGAGWSNITLVGCPENHDYEGKSIQQILEEKGTFGNVYEGFFDLMLEVKGEAMMVVFIMDEDDVKTVLSSNLSSIVSDSWVTSPAAHEKTHPRSYGTFPRFIGQYVRNEKLMSLEDGVRKITSLPASRIGLTDRGILKRGYKADIVVFDADKIIDTATFDKPAQYPEGIDCVIVNGQMTVEKGKHLGTLNGRILRKERGDK
jgi:N-acyl-D-amino-acid deacylase